MTRAHEDRGQGVFGRLTNWMRRRVRRTAAMGKSATVECPRHDDTENTAMSDDRVWDLIARHWAEQLGPGEEAALRAWAAESQERGEVLRGAERILDLSHELGEADETELAWERVRGRLRNERSVGYGPRFSHPMFGGLDDSAGRWRIASRPLRVVLWTGIAATLFLSTGIALRYRQASESPIPPSIEWATHAGERVTVELQDGSRVMLGPDTRLRVASADFKRERTLRLQGIAHFAVAHDPSRPFTVFAGTSSAQAVGTSFAVRAYPEDSTVHVVVSEGRVLFRPMQSRTSSGTMLEPGDAARVSATGVASIERGVDLDESLGWMRGELRYRMTTAADIARDLDRWYGVTIVFDDTALAAIHITTSFDPAWTAADAVQRFADVLNAATEANGGAIHLSRRAHGAMGTSPRSARARAAGTPP
jgi:ferric-dicitrate binding protein FerR (iron transport regulator)